ncbi:glycosyltransferase [Pinibacter soli]|uniref:Glycosyltransferase family 2 protein n=1 Tax=Pinibacter soli TaxID=3044211 RepID=A0ABT6R9F8_9BACT|nr:glycosyltransferase family 2 protein [Pinibacter soli]MDI3319056.1 glycosyltransferase family 2 protein [Pinibacter soli]
MNICLSIVVPTYQHPAALLLCLKALLVQSFDKNKYEIIVVSDGPDMATHQIVFDLIKSRPETPIITFCYLPYKKGRDAARNLGWQMAKGELVAFIDDDHVATADWAESFWMEHLKHEHESIVFIGNVNTSRVSLLDTSKNEVQPISASNCASTKTTLSKIKGFDEDFSRSWGDQNALHFKMLTSNVPFIQVEGATSFNAVRDVNWGINIWQSRQHVYKSKLFRSSSESIPWINYTIMTLLFAFTFVAWFWDLNPFALIALATWFLMVILLTIKRMENIIPSFTNIVEMMATSMFLPFLSIYWSLSSTFKLRILHLSRNKKKYESYFNSSDGIPASA